MLSIESIVIRLVLAAVFGGVIGFQRERQERPAGLRTHILVSVGSALFMLVSIFDFGLESDPTRIAAQVVTGIGFLGAGTIIRQGNIVTGLTTAASLWSVAAVGLAAGAGYYSAAAIGTLLIFVGLSFFKVVESKISPPRRANYRATVTARRAPGSVDAVRAVIAEHDGELVRSELGRSEDDRLVVTVYFNAQLDLSTEQLTGSLLALDDVAHVALDETPEAFSGFFGG
jgi:putative Mg2+ transporter-C (MgtC) family protein